MNAHVVQIIAAVCFAFPAGLFLGLLIGRNEGETRPRGD